MSSYRTPFGLPVRHKNESGIHIENEFLFGLYELILKDTLRHYLVRYIRSARDMGYPNHIHPSVPEKALSHDQVTAYVCYGLMQRTLDEKAIWEQIKGCKIGGRTLHPRDLIFYGAVNRVWYAILLLPLLYLIAAFTFVRHYEFRLERHKDYYSYIGLKYFVKSSSEMLWLLRLRAVKNDKLLRALFYPVEVMFKISMRLRFGGTKGLVKHYFYHDEEHPLVKELK